LALPAHHFIHGRLLYYHIELHHLAQEGSSTSWHSP
jgi:hypothetical protein